METSGTVLLEELEGIDGTEDGGPAAPRFICLYHTKLLSLGAQFLLTSMCVGEVLQIRAGRKRTLTFITEGALVSSIGPSTHLGSTWVPHRHLTAFHITAGLLCKRLLSAVQYSVAHSCSILFLVNASGQRHRLFSMPCLDRTALFCTSAHITGDSSTESPLGEFPERNNQISQSLSLVFLLILQLRAITPALQTVSDFSPTIWKRLPVHPVSGPPSSPRHSNIEHFPGPV